MQGKTVEIPTCKAGLPAEKYFIVVVNFVGVQFCDLEQVSGPVFYRWLNNMAMLCDLRTRFIEQDGWFDSPSDRWSAIQTLAGIARWYRQDERLITQGIYTEERVRKVLNASRQAIAAQ